MIIYFFNYTNAITAKNVHQVVGYTISLNYLMIAQNSCPYYYKGDNEIYI